MWAQVTLVLFVTASSVAEVNQAPGGPHYLASAVALITGFALFLRDRAPVAVGVVAAVAGAGWGFLLPLLVSAYTVASRGRLVVAVSLPVAAATVNTLILDRVPGEQLSLWSVRQYGPALLVIVALALGVRAHSRGRVIDELDTQLTHAAAERELREAAARGAERARIAAEMHDILAHRLSVIALHTGALSVGRHDLPLPVADRIGLLRTAATQALSDLRDVVGALREPGSERDGVAPTLQALADVVADARASGQIVDLEIVGDAAAIPTSHRLAVLRIVQEGLTNARKHAPEAPVSVSVTYGDDIEVCVRNPCGRPHTDGTSVPPSGYGLIGLRERVDALHGTLAAGGQSEWALTVRLPSPLPAEPL